jgi:hypothetical protein
VVNEFDGWLFFLMSLAVFRLTRLIVFDKITEFLRMPFLDEIEEKDEEGNIEIYLVPKQKGIRKWFGELLNCYWCTGIWVSIFLVVFYHFYPTIAEPIIVILAVAACGAILETLNSFLLDK